MLRLGLRRRRLKGREQATAASGTRDVVIVVVIVVYADEAAITWSYSAARASSRPRG